MLNGLYVIPKQAARFGAAATIQIFFDSPLINTANVVREWIIAALQADGWTVQGVTPLVAPRFLATVTGSTSDNMDAVRAAFIRTINNHGIILDNVEAGFVYQPISTTPTGGGTTGIGQAHHSVIVQFDFSPFWGTIVLQNAAQAVRSQLEAFGWNVQSVQGGAGMELFGAVRLRLTALVNSRFSDQDVINSLNNDLSAIGSISNIRIVQGSSGAPQSNPTQTSNGGNDKPDADDDDAVNSIEDFFKYLGSNLGLSAGSALAGGIAASALIAFILLRK